MGMTYAYTKNAEVNQDSMVDLIGQALDQGCNFFDGAVLYGEENSELLAKAIRKYGREKIILSTKPSLVN